MGSNLTCDFGPIIRIGFEAEMSAPLCPYLGSGSAGDVDRQRGNGNVGSFRHDIEHDAISTDAITVSRAPCCARWKNSTCWCREHDRRPCWLTSGRAQRRAPSCRLCRGWPGRGHTSGRAQRRAPSCRLCRGWPGRGHTSGWAQRRALSCSGWKWRGWLPDCWTGRRGFGC